MQWSKQFYIPSKQWNHFQCTIRKSIIWTKIWKYFRRFWHVARILYKAFAAKIGYPNNDIIVGEMNIRPWSKGIFLAFFLERKTDYQNSRMFHMVNSISDSFCSTPLTYQKIERKFLFSSYLMWEKKSIKNWKNMPVVHK